MTVHFSFSCFFPSSFVLQAQNNGAFAVQNMVLQFEWNSCIEIIHPLQIKIQCKCGIAFEKLLFIILCHVYQKTRAISQNATTENF